MTFPGTTTPIGIRNQTATTVYTDPYPTGRHIRPRTLVGIPGKGRTGNQFKFVHVAKTNTFLQI